MEMLKEEYRSRWKDQAAIKDDPELNAAQKNMLGEFFRHINYIPDKPSREDKLCVIKAYYEGMYW